MIKGNIKQIIKENFKRVLTIIVLTSILVVIFYISDIKCLFKYTIGVPCPGCGLTRAWLSFLKMDFDAAFKWHPLFWIVPVFIIIAVFMKGEVFKNKTANTVLWLLMLLLVFGVYSMRMIKLFPDQAPMDYNKQSLAYKCIISKHIE